LTGDTTARSFGNAVSFQSTIITGRTNSGTLAGTLVAQFNAVAGTHNSFATIGTWQAAVLNGPTVTGSGSVITNLTLLAINSGTVATSGVITTQIGLDIGAIANAATNISMRVQGTAPILLAPKTSLGSSSTTATWNAHVMGGNSATTALGLDTSTTAPTAPASNAAAVWSIYKGSGGTNIYVLLTFNDGGTTRYRYMQLNGTAATWTHATTLPT
jgi:hypothetical protein